MKNIYFTVAILVSTFICQAQIVDIPDANFKNTLVNELCVDTTGNGIEDDDVDINNDGEIQISEAEAVLWLNVSNTFDTPNSERISSLEGLQYFINLQQFKCGHNSLTSLDVSQNPSLLTLECEYNVLTNLDVSQAPDLTRLFCQGNLNLPSLNLTQNPNLEELNCNDNSLTSLDVSQNPNLEMLWCVSNDLASLDLTQNPNLEHLLCGDCKLTSLNLTQNPNLLFLDCSDNNLTSLNLAQNPNLEQLYCYNNNLTSLNFTQNPNFHALGAGNNQLTSLNLTQNPNLSFLRCDENQLTSLNVSQNPNLDRIRCDYNQLTNLDISQNPNLRICITSDNLLTSLNIKNGNNTNMIHMWAFNNPNLTCIRVDDLDFANNQDCNDDSWCKDAATDYSEGCTLGVTDTDYLDLISMYPNPVINTLNIVNNGIDKILSVRIYDQLGKLVLKEKEHFEEIGMSHLNRGLFFVTIETENNFLTEKIIKE